MKKGVYYRGTYRYGVHRSLVGASYTVYNCRGDNRSACFHLVCHGSLVALIANFCGANILVQAALFVGVSFAALLLTRPLVKKFSTPKIQRTNIDRIIGERAIVTEEIDNLRAIGVVKADGKSWSARSADGSIIPAGSVVEVQKIDGVKLIVGLIQNK